MTNICPNTIYKVTNLKRCKNTAAGNPVYEITLNGHTTLKTKPNISDAYKVYSGMTSIKVDTATYRGKTVITGINY